MPLWGFLFVWSLISSAPIILAVVLAQGRIGRRGSLLLIYAGYSAAFGAIGWILARIAIRYHRIRG